MAEEDPPAQVKLPEQCLAALLVKRLGLVPPIDVRSLAERFAEVEKDFLPGECDAILVPVSELRNKPLIILDKTKSPLRQRFTLAHEVGHLLIPWHVGMLACHTFSVQAYGDVLYRLGEGESNRFASELLMPRTWVQEIVRSHTSVEQMLRAVRTAEVSAAAASLALCQSLPPGHVFAILEPTGKVSISSSSPGTAVKAPSKLTQVNPEEYASTCSRHLIVRDGNIAVHWWHFEEVEPLELDDERISGNILKDILTSLKLKSSEAAKISMQVNGIIGAANRTYRPSTSAKLFTILRQRFVDRADLYPCTSHPDFEMFLSRRAEEIIQRNKVP